MLAGQFLRACQIGSLQEAQRHWHQNHELAKQANLDDAFLTACINGQIAVADWLLSVDSRTNISTREYAFRLTCEHGQLQAARWLWSLDHTGVLRDHLSVAFRLACDHQHLPVAQWLWSLQKGQTLHDQNARLFYAVCDSKYRQQVVPQLDFLVACTAQDLKIRYVCHQNNYYVVGIPCTFCVHVIDGTPVSSYRLVGRQAAYEALQLVRSNKRDHLGVTQFDNQLLLA